MQVLQTYCSTFWVQWQHGPQTLTTYLPDHPHESSKWDPQHIHQWNRSHNTKYAIVLPTWFGICQEIMRRNVMASALMYSTSWLQDRTVKYAIPCAACFFNFSYNHARSAQVSALMFRTPWMSDTLSLILQYGSAVRFPWFRLCLQWHEHDPKTNTIANLDWIISISFFVVRSASSCSGPPLLTNSRTIPLIPRVWHLPQKMGYKNPIFQNSSRILPHDRIFFA